MPNVPGLLQLPFEKICGERKEVEEKAVNGACLGMVALCDEDKDKLSTGRTRLASAPLVEGGGQAVCPVSVLLSFATRTSPFSLGSWNCFQPPPIPRHCLMFQSFNAPHFSPPY